MDPTSAPSVSTDLLDYAPGSTAIITAENFIIGSTLEFQVLHVVEAGDDGVWGTLDDVLGDNSSAGHEAWQVTDGVRTAGADGVLGTADDGGDLDGIADGNITTTWYVNPDDSLGATFLLTVSGDSTQYATASFTDAGGGKVDQLWQWANEELKWQTGNLGQSNSDYVEGDVVPYYLDLSNLTVGATYTVEINWDTTKGGKHSLDYITTYDLSNPPQNPAVHAGLSDTTADDTIAIPLDLFMASYDGPDADAAPDFMGAQLPGVFTAWNADLTNVWSYTHSGDYVDDSSTSIRFTFVAGAADVVIAWGGHIASVDDWGLGNSASQISGSSYHMRNITAFEDLDGDGIFEPGTNKDPGDETLDGAGNKDRSLSTDAVTIPASITILKDAFDPATGQDLFDQVFSFLITGPDGFEATFQLDDDGDSDIAQATFDGLHVGTYTITEVIPELWDLADIQTFEFDPFSSTGSVATAPNSVTITVSEGDAWTITFVDFLAFNPQDVVIGLEKRTLDGTTTAGAVAADFESAAENDLVPSDNTILVGEDVTWIYKITNPGTYDLSDISVTDNVAGVIPAYLSGDDGDQVLEVGETWYYTATDSEANAGAYSNTGTASGTYNGVTGEATDSSSYFGADPSLTIVKDTQDTTEPAGTPGDGNEILVDHGVKWIYTVANTGNVTLTDPVVTDSEAGVTPLLDEGLSSGEEDGSFDAGDVWVYTASGTAVAGLYENTGTAAASYTDDAGHTANLSENDSSSYFGADPQIAIEKRSLDGTTSAATAAADFALASDGSRILAGEDVSWIYKVTNAGNVALSSVSVTDSVLGVTPIYLTGDNGDNILQLGETWYYAAAGTAVAGTAITYVNLDGSSLGTGTPFAGGSASIISSSNLDGSAFLFEVDDQMMWARGVAPESAFHHISFDYFAEAESGANITFFLDVPSILRFDLDTPGRHNVDIYVDLTTQDIRAYVDDVLDNSALYIAAWPSTPVSYDIRISNQSSLPGASTGDFEIDNLLWEGMSGYSNTGMASGTYTDSAGHARTDTASDISSYFGADPQIDVEKYVSVDGGTTWVDADAPTGPTLVNSTGFDPQFKFVVTNTGNVGLSGVTLTDSDFNIDTANSDATIDIGNLGVGEAKTYYHTADWQFGQHTNTATVQATDYQDDAGHVREVNDSDDANYFGMYGGLVTSSSLCTFDTNPDLAGDQFNLIFTPDYVSGSNVYKLASSNPGQFYYNVFYQGAANTETDFTLSIPYPFVTHGATPIHVYGNVGIDEENGEICLTPMDALAGYKIDGSDPNVTIAPADEFGEYMLVTINDVMTDDDGFVYLNIHLDYDLKKTTGYTKSSPESGTDNALNPAAGLPDIMDDTDYSFSAKANGTDIVGSGDTVANDNIFKKSWGVGVLLQDEEGNALPGEDVSLDRTGWTNPMTGTTDEDGWYAWNFKHTGKAAAYEVTWDYSDAAAAEYTLPAGEALYESITLGGSTKWVQVDADDFLST